MNEANVQRITPGDPETQSEDVVAENIAQLGALFPEAMVEERVDFDVLRQLLGDAIEDREEKYGLTWHGKRRARQIALTPSTGTLRPCPDESDDWDTTQNLMIEGDNLEVLKLLQKSYAGKVKLIYIDPPYNTGNDFVYADDFRDGIRNYLELTGQVDGDSRPLSTNTEASGRYHTAWLNMMYPRLRLARDLLRPDGICLVSINDIEAPALRFLLSSIFGEEQFLCQFVWNNEGNVDQQSKIKGVHEYVIAFARRIDDVAAPTVIDPNIEEDSKLFNDQIENSITKNGPANPPSIITLPAGFPATFAEGSLPHREDVWPQILDDIVVQNSVLVAPARLRSGWSSKNLLDLFNANGCVPIADASGKETWFALTPSGAIYSYKKRSEQQGHVLSVIRNVGTTKQNGNMLGAWGMDFPYPKPLLLIQYLVQVFTRLDANDLVLDFFAGSGTTAHAVIAQNALDGGNRRWIAVQYPEPTGTANDASPANLFQLTVRRVARAGSELRGRAGHSGGDTGFRVFRLDSTNIQPWNPDRDALEGTLDEAVEHLKADRTEQDILYELLLKLGLDLCVPIESRDIDGKQVHAVGGGALLACLAPRISRVDVEGLANGIAAWFKELAPAGDATCVFRDSAFEDDVAKTNLAAILAQRGLTHVRSL